METNILSFIFAAKIQQIIPRSDPVRVVCLGGSCDYEDMSELTVKIYNECFHFLPFQLILYVIFFF